MVQGLAKSVKSLLGFRSSLITVKSIFLIYGITMNCVHVTQGLLLKDELSIFFFCHVVAKTLFKQVL